MTQSNPHNRFELKAKATIEPLRREHFERIDEAGLVGAAREIFMTWPIEPSDQGFACLVEGQVAAVFWVEIKWPGVADGFMFHGHLVHDYPHSFHRVFRHGIETVRQRYGLRRIQVDVPAAYLPRCEWVEHLGFKSEGVMEEYGVIKEGIEDFTDFIRYARVWRGENHG